MSFPNSLRHLLGALLLGLAASWPAATLAQSLDASFAATQLEKPAYTSNAVQQADGRLVVSVVPPAYYQGQKVMGIIRLNLNGSLDQTFGTTWLQAGGAAWSMRVFPNGNILAVGSSFRILESLGGRDLYKQDEAVVMHPDGSLDRQFNPVISGGYANAGEVQPDGKILLGGSFTAVNNTALGRLARLLPNGQLDPAFTLAAGGFNGNVTSIRLQPDGKILVGGDFTACGGTTRSHLARLLPDGSLDASFAPAIPAAASFLGFALQPDGKLVVNAVSNGLGLYRLLADGSRDTSFAASIYDYLAYNPPSDQVVAVQPSGAVLLAGSFTRANGQPCASLVRVLPTGALDAPAPYGTDSHGLVSALCPLADGSVVGCGSFAVLGHLPTGFARVLPSGQLDPAFGLPVTGTGSIAAVLPLAGGRLLVGGSFSRINGVAAWNLAFLRADGTVDAAATQALPPLEDPVMALAPGLQGTTYVGGYFYESANPARRYLLRLLSTGGQDPSFVAPSLSSGVNTLAAYPDGRLLLGGSFTAPKANLLRLTAQGTLDNSFTAGFGTYVPYVSSLVLQRDEKLAALTYFSSWQLAPQGSLVGQSTTVPRFLHALAVQPDGYILVGGEFNDFAGVTRNSLVRLTPAGAVDASFDAGSFVMQNGIASVKALAVQADGRILCGGYFSSIQGQPHRGIARLLPSGQVDNTFADLVFLHPETTCLVIPGAGRLLAGTSALSPQSASYLQPTAVLTQGLTCLVVPGLTGAAPAGQALAATPGGTPGEISLYPSPAQQEFRVQAGAPTTPLTVTIYDVTGRTLRQVSGPAASLHVEVADLAPATYVVGLRSEQETVYRKLVVQH